jgi:hypothetical protein
MLSSLDMDPRENPYSPGAGTPPPELAGRDEQISQASVSLARIRAKRGAQSFIFYGLRGVGKTVLLNKVRRDAEAEGFVPVWMEAPEDRSLPALLAPALRAALFKLERSERAKSSAQRALKALAGFARALRLKYHDLEIALDCEPDKGVADSGDLESDLADLLRAVGDAAANNDTVVVLFIDELQYVKVDELAALITALHSANQNQLPVTLMAAGLPQLLGQTGRAKSYAERLFQFLPIDSLEPRAARDALCVPAEKAGVIYDARAIEIILEQTRGYPYFIQEWGKHCWDLASASPIDEWVAQRANVTALAELDASFFRVRFDRLTPSEKAYLRAMAELGPGPHRSGDIADQLKKKVTTVAPIRNALIAKGMIYSPAHGDTAFTVPLFDAFMKRTIAP